ncbi:MAG: hypothetical protein AAGF26_14925, partial [Cyanobacteria bacterium P01_G01_bin.49]
MTATTEFWEGWQYWLGLGLISEVAVNTKITSFDESFQFNLNTKITATNLIERLQAWQAAGLFSEDMTINFTVKVNSSHPQLLSGLDRWLQLGLLNSGKVRQLCDQYLTCSLQLVAEKPSETVTPSQPSKPRQKRRKAPNLGQVLQSLMTELSVIWLLLLGVFMVVISSAVLAASWWETFPAVLQYGILWVYTLGFGISSWWTGKQANLRLTTQALRTITLLLVPINFLAMDSFPLWQSFWGLLGMILGSLSLTVLTISIFRTQSQLDKPLFPLLNHLGLAYLNWGWTFIGFPLIATYVGVIGTTIISLVSPNNAAKKSQKFLPFSLTGAIVIYALIILLIRSIFIAQVNIFYLGLAIGLCGWLMGWRSPPKTLWKWVGSSL